MSKTLSNQEVQDILHRLHDDRAPSKSKSKKSKGGSSCNDTERIVGGAKGKKVHNLGQQYAKEIMDAEKDLVGSGFWDNFKKGFNSVVAPFIPLPVAQLVKPTLEAVGYGKATKVKKTRQLSARQKARNAMISKLMKQEGMTLPEASKHIKTNNLV